MIDILFYPLFILFAAVVLKKLLFITWLWQVKEYRMDRMAAHFMMRSEWKHFLNTFVMAKLALLIVLFFFTQSWIALAYAYIILLLIQCINIILEVKKTGLIRPKKTAKAYLIMVLTIITIVALVFSFSLQAAWILLAILLILDLTTHDVATIFVQLVNPATQLAKKNIIQRARKKMIEQENLKVIGITGSYGKSSTKEALYSVLSKKYKVLMTPENVNTEIGVAQVVLRDLKNEHEIFIVEMGAESRGEIQAICDIVSPDIGILTAINPQHLATFKSVDTIVDTKMALIRSVPTNGIALLNTDNEYLHREAKNVQGKKLVSYSLENQEASIYAKNVIQNKRGIEFRTNLVDETFTVPVLGVHNIYSYLPAIYLGKELNVENSVIMNALMDLSAVEHRMNPIIAKNKALYIDDTYSANPDGLRAAAAYLNEQEGKKIAVISPMIELGKESILKHIQVGEYFAKTVNRIYLVSTDFSKEFAQGYSQAGGDLSKLTLVLDHEKLADILMKDSGDDTVIYFSGRKAGKVLRTLIAKQ